MGTYKVPQNVEAEDKILGPLSLKQFIYAIIGVGYGFLTFAIFQQLILVWVIIGLPPMLFLLALGLYQKEDQPLETYVVAIANFFFRPKQRLWTKEPIAEVFHLEPPAPKPEPVRRDPREVRSQLSQLADVVDTRGWSEKNPDLQEPDEVPVIDLRDRIGSQPEPQLAPSLLAEPATVLPADDMLAAQGPRTQAVNVLIQNTVQSVRQEALDKMRTPAVAPATSTTSGLTQPPSGDILKLAAEGGDLTVAQIAAQAHKQHTLTEGQAVSVRNG